MTVATVDDDLGHLSPEARAWVEAQCADIRAKEAAGLTSCIQSKIPWAPSLADEFVRWYSEADYRAYLAGQQLD